MKTIRFSASRREETALALDMCASSRWAPGLRMALQGRPESLHDSDTVSTSDLGWLTDLHWRSIDLAGSAFYATMYDDGWTSGLDFFEICAESAQRLRDGWFLVECPSAGRFYGWRAP